MEKYNLYNRQHNYTCLRKDNIPLIYLFIYLNIFILGVPITRGILTWCPDTEYK